MKPPKEFNFDAFVAGLKGPTKILFFVTVITISLALMDRLMLGPFLSQEEYLKAEHKAQRENIRRSKRIISFRDRILEEYNQYSAYLDSGELTQEAIVAALLKKIETLAGQQAVTITGIRPGDVEEKPIYKIYKTSLDCEGQLSNVLSFINLLEQSDYLFQVQRYSMGPKSKGSDIIKCTMDIARILVGTEDVFDLQAPAEAPATQEAVTAEAPVSRSMPAFQDVPAAGDEPASQEI